MSNSRIITNDARSAAKSHPTPEHVHHAPRGEGSQEFADTGEDHHFLVAGLANETGARSSISTLEAQALELELDDSEIVVPGIVAVSPKPVYDFLKRVLDFMTALVALIVAGIPMLVIACMVKLTSNGPILFKQRRIGLNGRPFWIYKFRSMRTEAPKYAVTPADDFRDDRVTTFGKYLRKTGLDELPQIFCVLSGTMSFIGPRPEMPFLIAQYNERQLRRLAIKPGITGPWQISEARIKPIHENLKYDRYYLAYRSLWLDFKILCLTAFKTVAAIFHSVLRIGRRGARLLVSGRMKAASH